MKACYLWNKKEVECLCLRHYEEQENNVRIYSTLKTMLPVFKNDYQQSLNIIRFRQLEDVSTVPG